MVTRNKSLDKRMHYFDRQFLRAQDFADEQDYILDRLKRPIRLLNTAGVAEGLGVAIGPEPNTLTISPGTAMDEEGRQIVLLEERTVALPTDQEQLDLYIAYGETQTDPSDDPGIDGFTRITESPQFFAIAPSDPAPELGILLAHIILTDGEAPNIDVNVRQLAGSKAPIGDLSIEESMLADDAVSSRTIQDNAITENKLANASVSSPSMQNEAVSASKITNNAINSSKIDSADGSTDQDVSIGSGVKTDHLQDGSVTSAKLQSHSTNDNQRAVGKQHIKDGSISISQLDVEIVADLTTFVPGRDGEQWGETDLNIVDARESAFLLISVHIVDFSADNPGTVEWRDQSTFGSYLGLPFAIRTLKITNSSDAQIEVAVKTYRLSES